MSRGVAPRAAKSSRRPPARSSVTVFSARAEVPGAIELPNDCGLGKLPTLRARREFVHVQTRGRRFKGRHAVVLVEPNHLDEARVGVTVSRKVGNAVVRNRVRRRVREVLRLNRALLRPAHDHVVIAFPRAATASFAVFREELICLLQRAHDSASVKHS